MTALKELRKRLRPGQVYRRADLARWSNAVDRHVNELVEEGRLVKVSGGLYSAPKKTRFGRAPADPHKLVASFLNDDRFLMMSPNAYNGLGVGTTQLYNETVVYNHKRHGQFNLDRRTYDFRMKPAFPKRLTVEFLMVDLLNNIGRLSEDEADVVARVKERAADMNAVALRKAVKNFGGIRAQRELAA